MLSRKVLNLVRLTALEWNDCDVTVVLDRYSYYNGDNCSSFIVSNLFLAHEELLGAGAGDVVPLAVCPALLHAVLHRGSCRLAPTPWPPVGPGARHGGIQSPE